MHLPCEILLIPRQISQYNASKILIKQDSPKRTNWQRKIDEISALDAAGR
jgi:hypothetical protein